MAAAPLAHPQLKPGQIPFSLPPLSLPLFSSPLQTELPIKSSPKLLYHCVPKLSYSISSSSLFCLQAKVTFYVDRFDICNPAAPWTSTCYSDQLQPNPGFQSTGSFFACICFRKQTRPVARPKDIQPFCSSSIVAFARQKHQVDPISSCSCHCPFDF